MRMMTKMLTGAAGLAAIAAAAPAAAQYYPSYNSPYGYNSYNNYGAYGVNAGAAAQQCTAAVQNRLANRTSLGSILGSLVGIPARTYGRVLSVTNETPTRNGMRIRGLASSGRYAYNSYGPYGVGAYGALGYGANAGADLSWRCDVDYRGFVRNVDINRRY
ncbi:MAG TPA: hypothetical protein VFW35_06460 [Sphingomicrobium sp.]|nr:hypothetical protein [Sphingomicrobium sp.]